MDRVREVVSIAVSREKGLTVKEYVYDVDYDIDEGMIKTVIASREEKVSSISNDVVRYVYKLKVYDGKLHVVISKVAIHGGNMEYDMLIDAYVNTKILDINVNDVLKDIKGMTASEIYDKVSVVVNYVLDNTINFVTPSIIKVI